MHSTAGNAFLDNLVNCGGQALATSIANCFGGISFRNRSQIYKELGPSTFHSILKHLDLDFFLNFFCCFFSFNLFFFLFFSPFDSIHLAGKALMALVPPERSSLPEIRDWVRTAMEGTEKWQKMRVIVIGHGRIGKTSLIHTLQDSLVCKNIYQVLFLWLFTC